MPEKSLILCIDDEQSILDLLAFNLKTAGYDVICASTAAEGLEASSRLPALIILDLILPDMDGTEVCRRLKAQNYTSSIPIIILTAKDLETDKVAGLESGADDYMTKPFSMRELIARIGKLMQRYKLNAPTPGIIKIGPLIIDSMSFSAFRNGVKLRLTLKEYELLQLLASSPGHVFMRDEILDRVWGDGYYGGTRMVDVYIRHLRQKLQEDAGMILTVRGVGYKMILPKAE